MGRFIDITGAPIVSDFQEMPLDFMAKALSAKQASYDKQDLEAAGIPGLIPEGFIATKGYKDILTKELAPKLDEWSKRAIADPEGVGREITKYKSQLANDIRYKKLVEDTALKAGYLEKIAKLNESGIPYEKAFDYKTGQYRGPIDPDKLVKGEVTGNLQEFYGNPFYGDPNKEMREVFSTIKPITSQNAHEYMAGITDLGDQLKRGESIEMSSSTLDDPRIIFYTGEGKNKRGVTLGELTQKKFNDAYATWLAGNTVGAQYYQTELSPALKVNLGLPPDATLSDKQAAYAEHVYNPMAVYTDKRSYDFATFGTNKYSVDINIPTDPNFNPWVSQTNKGNDFDGFITTIVNSKNVRDKSWQELTNSKDGLINKTTVSIPGLIRNANGAYTNTEIQNIINYWQSGKAMVDYANNPTKLSELKTLYNSASAYQMNDHQLKFYTNQVSKLVQDTYKEQKEKYKTNPTKLKLVEETFKPLIANPESIISSGGKFYLPLGGKELGEKVVKGLNISQAYVMADKTGNYSKEGFGIADNIWGRVSSGKLLFEGMGKGATADELDRLFKAKTGESPKGALIPVGTALDGNNRIITIVQDKETGKIADFTLQVPREDLTKTRKIYIDMAHSNDPMAQDVGKQGLTESVLATSGELYKWDNLTSSNQPTSANILGLKVTKEFDDLGNSVYSYDTKAGKRTSIGEKNLKTDIGTILLAR